MILKNSSFYTKEEGGILWNGRKSLNIPSLIDINHFNEDANMYEI